MTKFLIAGFGSIGRRHFRNLLALGQKDRALDVLERAYQQHSSYLTILKVDPRLDPLRQEPRCRALALKLKLQ